MSKPVEIEKKAMILSLAGVTLGQLYAYCIKNDLPSVDAAIEKYYALHV